MELSEHKFFSFFPSEPGELLIEHAEVVTFDGPEVLFEEGDDGGIMYLILEGEVEISGTTSSGKHQTISVLREHEFFGEFSAIDGLRRNARAQVLGPSKLAAIHRDHFLTALDISPVKSTQAFLAHVIQRIRRFHGRFFQEIVRNQKMLLVGELTNTIMHDIKSPMSIIMGTASVISDRYPEDEEVTQLCSLIDMQVNRVQEMSSEVLDYVRGSTTIVQRQVNLKTLFPYFDLLNRDFFNRQDIELVIGEPDISLYADPDKIVRVLQNLANNAAQAMPNGGRIEVDAKVEGAAVIITVKDDGTGIPEDIRDHLFEPFVGEGKHGGTGLGTTIALSLVNSHGGRLTFDTSENGTVFYITLPKRLDSVI
jgi:signal transduction histidine kinase